MGIRKEIILIIFLTLFFEISTESFICSSDSKTTTIASDLVDDNYCDCFKYDINDEPNTPACSNYHSSKFICHRSPISLIPNENSLPLFKKETFFAADSRDFSKNWIYSSQVQDGVCDCCDGSDEIGPNKSKECPNTCNSQLESHINKILKEAGNNKLSIDNHQDIHEKGAQKKEEKVPQIKKILQEKNKILLQLRKQYSSEVQKIQNAMYSGDQYSYQIGMKKVNELMKNIREIESLAKVHKERKELSPIIGECISIISNEKDFKSGSFDSVPRDFKFTLCPFINITQIEVVPSSKKDKPNEVVLGYWDSEFNEDKENVWDEEISIKQLYTQGEKCYNGPDRVAQVIIECGEKNEIVEVREDGKCQYKVRLRSPFTCQANYSNALREYAEKGKALLERVRKGACTPCDEDFTGPTYDEIVVFQQAQVYPIMRRAERRNLRMEERVLLRRRRVLRRTRKLHRKIIAQSLHTYKASLVFLLIFRKRHIESAGISISKPGLHAQVQSGTLAGRGYVAFYVQDHPPTGVYKVCVDFKGYSPRHLWKAGAILSVLDFRTGILGQTKTAIARAIPIPSNAVGDKWMVGDFVVSGPTFGWLNRSHVITNTFPSNWNQAVVYNGAPLNADYEEDYCKECTSSSESSSSDSEGDEVVPSAPSNVQVTVPLQMGSKDTPLYQQPQQLYYPQQVVPSQPIYYQQPQHYAQPYPQQPPIYQQQPQQYAQHPQQQLQYPQYTQPQNVPSYPQQPVYYYPPKQ